MAAVMTYRYDFTFTAHNDLRDFQEACDLLQVRGLVVTVAVGGPIEVGCPACGGSLMMPLVPAYLAGTLFRLDQFVICHPERCQQEPAEGDLS